MEGGGARGKLRRVPLGGPWWVGDSPVGYDPYSSSGLGDGGLSPWQISVPPVEAGSPCAGTCICKGRAQVLTRHVDLHPWGLEGFRQGCAPRICPRAWSGRRREGGCCRQLSPDAGASPEAANPNCGD